MDHRLFDILACPVCKGPIKYDRHYDELVCSVDRLAYPIVDDIPVMIEGQARQLSSEEVEKWASE